MLHAVMPNDIDRHPDFDDLERYSMQRMSEEDEARIDEHLLLCEPCRNELDRVEYYASAMRSASKEQERYEKQAWWRFDWMVPALAGLALLLIGVFVVPQFLSNLQAPLALALTATRSADVGTSAPAGRRLALTPDLTGLAPDSAYRLEIVDEKGNTTWQGQLAAGQGAVAVPAQRSGPHFVRIYSSTGELLREYGLDIKR